jgi:hypothetical protein
MRRSGLVALLLTGALSGCSPVGSSGTDTAAVGGGAALSEPTDPAGSGPTTPPDAGTSEATGMPPASPRPDWLGNRPLPLAPDGFGERLPTPPELTDRRLPPPASLSALPAPPADGTFRGLVDGVPSSVVTRSTWRADCPVTLEDLRYVLVTYIGFDGLAYTGELIIHASVADDIVDVFKALHALRFPLEEVRVIAPHELTAPATGDGNVTTAFVCRPAVGSTRWSEHAYGLAVDLNPFHNPYVRGDLVLPELAGAYVDRTDVRPGMILTGDAVTDAFRSIGWTWGGDWTGVATDPMHFSRSGR